MEDGGGREESWRGEGGGEGGEWGTGWDLGLRIHPGSENEEAAMGRPWAGGLGGGAWVGFGAGSLQWNMEKPAKRNE